MHTYTAKTFDLPSLEGISTKQVEVHLKLYQGYVTHTNLIREKRAELSPDKEKNAFIINELRRRFAFEWDGMRMHEYYFEQFEGGANPPADSGPLLSAIVDKYQSMDGFRNHFEEVALSRGIGWTVLTYDPIGKTPHVSWVSDHELGQLAGLPVILALDMWEHAFMVDYVPGEKKKYIEAFFKNLNWQTIEARMNAAAK